MYGDLGGLLSFPSDPKDPTTVLVRVGVSLISAEQACENAEEEIADFNFEGVHRRAKDEWNELLGRFHVQVEDKDTAVLFYSSVNSSSNFKKYLVSYTSLQIYRSHIVPADCKYSATL